MGSYTVTASASGATSATFALTNDKLSTTTSVTSAPNPSVYNQAVTFTATVSSTQGIPDGVVTFYDNGVILGSGSLNASGQVTLTTAGLAAGTHPTITASYGGSTNYTASVSAAYTQVVNSTCTPVSGPDFTFAPAAPRVGEGVHGHD